MTALLIFFVFVLGSVLKNSPHACVCSCAVKHILKTHSSWVEQFSIGCKQLPIFVHPEVPFQYGDWTSQTSLKVRDETYVHLGFSPLQFPSTPMLVLFKVSAALQPFFFVASNRSWTCIHPLASRIPPDLCLFLYPTFGSSRHCCSSLLDNFYYTPPQIFWGDFTICPPGHMVGVTRLERATWWSQTTRSTNWATPRCGLFIDFSKR